jgi:hypothetical protein
MDANYDRGGRGFPTGSRRSFGNANNIELFVQQQIRQEEARSPGYNENYSLSGSGSPTPPAATYQQTAPQPYATAYYPISSVSMAQSMSSPASPQFALTSDIDYPLDMSFGGPSANGGGMPMSRNHSIE